MNLLKLFSYHVVLFVVLYHGSHCESGYIKMSINEVQVTDGATDEGFVFTNQALIKVSEDQDTYFFLDDRLIALCGETFTSENVEIRSVFNRTLNFSLIITADKSLTLFCEFETNRDLQLFFNQIRKTFPLEGPVSVSVHRSILFALDRGGAPIANNGLFYKKEINKPREVRATCSYNLVRLYSTWNEATGSIIQTQEADLVFLARTFNITGLIDGDKVGLCLLSIPNNSLVLLRFADHAHASLFIEMVKEELNEMISCSVNNIWIAQRRHLIDAREPFALPLLPYLKKDKP